MTAGPLGPLARSSASSAEVSLRASPRTAATVSRSSRSARAARSSASAAARRSRAASARAARTSAAPGAASRTVTTSGTRPASARARSSIRSAATSRSARRSSPGLQLAALAAQRRDRRLRTLELGRHPLGRRARLGRVHPRLGELLARRRGRSTSAFASAAAARRWARATAASSTTRSRTTFGLTAARAPDRRAASRSAVRRSARSPARSSRPSRSATRCSASRACASAAASIARPSGLMTARCACCGIDVGAPPRARLGRLEARRADRRVQRPAERALGGVQRGPGRPVGTPGAVALDAPQLPGPLRRGRVPVGRTGRLAVCGHPFLDGDDDGVAVPPRPAPVRTRSAAPAIVAGAMWMTSR